MLEKTPAFTCFSKSYEQTSSISFISRSKVVKIEIKNLGLNNEVIVPESVKLTGNMRIVVEGNNNLITIGNNTTLGNGLIEIRNNRACITIGEYCLINGWIRCRANETEVNIGSKTTMMWVQVTLHEKGIINIGEDCMFSGDIRMDVSDMHSILDLESNRRINPPGNITIEDHVWVGQGVHILKGNTIGSNSILGAKALITTSIPGNSIAAGVPAKVIRTGVTWDRKLLPLDSEII